MRKRLSVVLCVAAYLLLGVPVWWHTTKIQRPALPHAHMQGASSAAAAFRLPVAISIHVAESAESLDTEALAEGFWRSVVAHGGSQGLPESYLREVLVVRVVSERPSCRASTWSAADRVAGASCAGLSGQPWEPGASDEDVDASWAALLAERGLAAPGSYHIAVVPHHTHAQVPELIIGRHRGAVLRVPPSGDGRGLRDGLVSAVEAAVPAIVTAFLAKSGGPDAGFENQLPLSPAGEALLSFSLCNAEPDDHFVSWDFAALQHHLAPVEAALRPAMALSTESQVLLYARSPERGVWSGEHGAFVLRVGALPRFVDSHWNLNAGGLVAARAVAGTAGDASDSTSDPTEALSWHEDGGGAARPPGHAIPPHVLHFVAYVPPEGERPLRVLLPDGTPSPTNGFTIPKWGGVHVLPSGGDLRPAQPRLWRGSAAELLSDAEMARLASVVVMQLRALLQLEQRQRLRRRPEAGSGAEAGDALRMHVVTAGGSGFSAWEVDALLRQVAGHNAAAAARTLGSLSRLVEQLPTLEMPQLIGTQVDAALRALSDAVRLAAAGEYHAAARAAQEAHTQAEGAFSNPAVLAQLSYPQSHLIGVYVPLFLPLGVTVVAALFTELSRLRAKKAAEDKHV